MNNLTGEDASEISATWGSTEFHLSKRFAYLFDPRLNTSTLHFYNMVNHAMREYVQRIAELDTDGQVRKVLEPNVRSLYSRVLDSGGRSTLARGVIADFESRFNHQGDLVIFFDQADLVTLVCDLRRIALNHCAMFVYCTVLNRLHQQNTHEGYTKVRKALVQTVNDGVNPVLDNLDECIFNRGHLVQDDIVNMWF